MQHWEIVNNHQYVVNTNAEELWENAVSYFRWCDENPIENLKTIMAGKETGTAVTVTSTRPYTIKALCLHCGISEAYLKDIAKGKDKFGDYFVAVDRIMNVIYTQNLEQAMVGEFNPILTGKVLNLEVEADDMPSKITVEVVQGLPALAESEEEVLRNLESENGNIEITESENL